MLLSFAYLAFSAVLRLLVGCQRSEFATEVERLVLPCGISCCCFGDGSRGRRSERPIAPSSLRSAGCSRLEVGTG